MIKKTMSNKHKYKTCSTCKGTLIPKKDHKSKDWSLICENKEENKCFEVFFDPDYQEIFKELEKWKINEFEIHDLIKIGKPATKILQAMLFINNLDITVYKKKIEALRDILNSPFNFLISSFVIKLKYKLPIVYSSIKLAFIFIVIFFSIVSFSLLNLSYEDEFLTLSKPIVVDTSAAVNQKKDTVKKSKLITNQDSDKDGITDNEEINKYKTNPLDPDTDSDGYNDLAEIKSGYDPLSPAKTKKIN